MSHSVLLLILLHLNFDSTVLPPYLGLIKTD